MPELLVCANCGGPLPPPVAQIPYVRCTFCRSTSSLRDGTLIEQAPGGPAEGAEGERERVAREAVSDPERRVQFWQDYMTALGAKKSPIGYSDVRELARRHLGVFGDSDVLARVSYKLALDFQAESGQEMRTAVCLGRFGQGYVEAINALCTAPSTELNLPFLTGGPQGPTHYRRALDAAIIARLAEGDPAEPTPKRGFFAKLFG